MVLNLFKFLGSGGKNESGFLRSSVSSITSTKIKSDWANIDVLLKGKQPSQIRQAVILADKALDNALRDVVSGTTMGERLKNSRGKFNPDLYNKIWSAHKMRNALVHESGYEPPYHMAVNGINNLKKGLKSLGVNI